MILASRVAVQHKGSQMHKKVLIAAHQHLGFEALRYLLDSDPDYKVTDYVLTESELIKSIETDTPDFILMCFAFESANGVSYISRLRKIAPNTPVIVLSATFRSIEVISSLYQSGAAGYLCTTTCTLDLLFETFDAIQRVGYFFPPDLLKSIVINQSAEIKKSNLTQPIHLGAREKEILIMIAEGHSACEIAKLLNISTNTVNAHRHHIMKKLNLNKSIDLTKYAIKHQLIRL